MDDNPFKQIELAKAARRQKAPHKTHPNTWDTSLCITPIKALSTT